MPLRIPFATVQCMLVALLVFTSVPASADEVQLQNGDRITGRVIRLAGGILTFNTPAGDLNIPWTAVTALTSTQMLRVTLSNRGRQTITALAMSAPGELTLTPG